MSGPKSSAWCASLRAFRYSPYALSVCEYVCGVHVCAFPRVYDRSSVAQTTSRPRDQRTWRSPRRERACAFPDVDRPIARALPTVRVFFRSCLVVFFFFCCSDLPRRSEEFAVSARPSHHVRIYFLTCFFSVNINSISPQDASMPFERPQVFFFFGF